MLVGELVELAPAQIAQLPLSEEARELAAEVHGLKGGARKRQVKYITKLLRHEPVEPIYDFMTKQKGSALRRNREFHEIEYLRDILIEEAINARRQAKENHRELEEDWSSTVVQDIAKELPSIDSRELTRLGFLFAMTRSKRHSREIFRMLHASREQEELSRKMENDKG